MMRFRILLLLVGGCDDAANDFVFLGRDTIVSETGAATAVGGRQTFRLGTRPEDPLTEIIPWPDELTAVAADFLRVAFVAAPSVELQGLREGVTTLELRDAAGHLVHEARVRSLVVEDAVLIGLDDIGIIRDVPLVPPGEPFLYWHASSERLGVVLLGRADGPLEPVVDENATISGGQQLEWNKLVPTTHHFSEGPVRATVAAGSSFQKELTVELAASGTSRAPASARCATVSRSPG